MRLPTHVPWAALVSHERQAQRNHGGQSLATLASRGGLSASELVAVLEDRNWTPMDAGLAAYRLLDLLGMAAVCATVHVEKSIGVWAVTGDHGRVRVTCEDATTARRIASLLRDPGRSPPAPPPMDAPMKMHPGGVWPLEAADYEKLDPGIRTTVRMLVAAGFRTTDSGDGRTKIAAFGGDCDGTVLDVPHVAIQVLDSNPIQQTNALWRLLLYALKEPPTPGMVQLTYDPAAEIDAQSVILLTGIDDTMLAGDADAEV